MRTSLTLALLALCVLTLGGCGEPKSECQGSEVYKQICQRQDMGNGVLSSQVTCVVVCDHQKNKYRTATTPPTFGFSLDESTGFYQNGNGKTCAVLKGQLVGCKVLAGSTTIVVNAHPLGKPERGEK